MILSFLNVQNLIPNKIYLVTVFLHGTLEEVVYMQNPKGYEKGDPSQVLFSPNISILGI